MPRTSRTSPGRKTDAADATWLAELCEIGLLRPSFIPPPDIAALPQLTRYRKKLIEGRTSESQRLRKVGEDGGIKLDSVASDVLGVSGRAMIEALIAGERDPVVLAELAKGVLRRKIPDLTLALSGRFGERHAQMCQLHLRHLDDLSASIADLDARIRATAAPFGRQIALLMTIPGIGERLAQVIVAEIGVDMSRLENRRPSGLLDGGVPGQPRIGR
jgi:transposase